MPPIGSRESLLELLTGIEGVLWFEMTCGLPGDAMAHVDALHDDVLDTIDAVRKGARRA